MNSPDVDIGRNPDIVDKLNTIIDTEARHRGMTISNAEQVNFFLARFLSGAKSPNNDVFIKLFNRYFPKGIGTNIKTYRDMRAQIEDSLSELLGGYKFDEILKDLEVVRDARNKMAHATSNRFQETIDKDISTLQTTSFYLHKRRGGKSIVKIQMTDDELKRIIDIVQRLQVKLLTITLHVNPKVESFSLESTLGV